MCLCLIPSLVLVIHSIHNDVRNASSDIRRVQDHLVAFNIVLSQLQAVILPTGSLTSEKRQPIVTSLAFGRLLQEAEGILRETEALASSLQIQGRRSDTIDQSLKWPSKKKKVTRLLGQFEKLQNIFSSALLVDNHLSNQELEQYILSALHSLHEEQSTLADIGLASHELNLRTLRTAKKSATSADDAERVRILRWLSAIDPVKKHKAVHRLRHPDTCDWIFRTDPILRWAEKGGLFWLGGLAGAGKTVLLYAHSCICLRLELRASLIHLCSSALVEELRSHSLEFGDRVAFHYCDFRDQASLYPPNILGAFLRQLISALTIPDSIKKSYFEHSFQGESNADALTDFIVETINSRNQPAYLLLDGLDECKDRAEVLRCFERLLDTCDTSLLRLLISSRPEYDIQRQISRVPDLVVDHEKIAPDVLRYVQAEVSSVPRLKVLGEGLQASIIEALWKGAQGMFRWVQCQLASICKARTRAEIRNVMATLPESLEETYDRMFQNTDESDMKYVLRAMNWLVHGKRKLNLAELAEAVAIDPEKILFDTEERLVLAEELLAMCGCLICVRTDTDTVDLAHYSVKEYLLSTRSSVKVRSDSWTLVNAEQAKNDICHAMLSYFLAMRLQMAAIPDYLSAKKAFPLFTYVKDHFFSHCYSENPQAMRKWTRQLFAEGKAGYVLVWPSLKSVIESHTSHIIVSPWWCWEPLARAFMWVLLDFVETNLHFQEKSSIQSNMQFCIDSLIDMQSRWELCRSTQDPELAGTYRSPLGYAAIFGFKNAIGLLIDNGASIDGVQQLHYWSSPLILAIDHRREDIVRYLLARGADVNVSSIRGTPIITALGSRSGTSALLPFLLDSGANSNTVTMFGFTAHHWAKTDTSLASDFDEQLRDRFDCTRTTDMDYFDAQKVRGSALSALRKLEKSPYQEFCAFLAQCLFRLSLIEDAIICSELLIFRGEPIEHVHHFCGHCKMDMFRQGDGGVCSNRIQGNRYKCLICHDGDFCTACYESWVRAESLDEPRPCRGHKVVKIPRDEWWTLEPGTVNAKRESSRDFIRSLIERFEDEDQWSK